MPETVTIGGLTVRKRGKGPLPEPEPTVRERSVRLTEDQWSRIEDAQKKGGYSANKLLQHFVDWCFQEIDRVAANEPHEETAELLAYIADRYKVPPPAELWAEFKKASEKKGVKR